MEEERRAAEWRPSGCMFNIAPATSREVTFLLFCADSPVAVHFDHVLQQAGARGPPEILCGHSREKTCTFQTRERKKKSVIFLFCD